MKPYVGSFGWSSPYSCPSHWSYFRSISDNRLNLKTRDRNEWTHQRACSLPFLRDGWSFAFEEELPLFSFVDSWPSTKRYGQPLIFWFSCFVSKLFPEHVRMLVIETAKKEVTSHTVISFGLPGSLRWSTVVCRRMMRRSFSFSRRSWIRYVVIIWFVQHEHFRSLN